MTILSILIPTIPERGEMFTKLYNEVMNQVAYMRTVHPSLGEVEVLVDDSIKFLDGGLSIGKKRDALLKRASGKYLCFVDDDERISGNYIEKILRLAQSDKDVITFRSFCRLENFSTVVDMSIHYPGNEDANPDHVIFRRPWHICPVRSVFAKLHNFDDINYGEDWLWFEKVLGHCTTEEKTYAILHEYHHGKHSEADKITNHELLAKSRTGSNH